MRIFGQHLGFLPLFVAAIANAQAPAPVADALRKYSRTAATNLVLAAEAMPADKYAIRPSHSERTFGETVAYTSNVSAGYCKAFTSLRDSSGFADPTLPKNDLVALLRAKLDFCRAALSELTDTGLQDTVGAYGRKPRAEAILEATALWAEHYEHMISLMRRHGQIPPVQCTGDGGPIHGGVPCGSGWSVCTSDRDTTLRGLTVVIADLPNSVRSDGRGPYQIGRNVIAATLSSTAAMVLGDPQTAPEERRAILVDLDHPVSGDSGIRHGVIRDDMQVRVLVQWGKDSLHRTRNMHGIPVGGRVAAGTISVEFHIGGVVHLLQVGPQPVGHCLADGTAVQGNGTSEGTISRPDSTTWVVDLPPGSVGRLFDVSHRYPYAVNKGLYHVSMRFVFTARR